MSTAPYEIRRENVKFVKVSLLLLVPLLLLATLVFLTTGAASYKVYVIHTGSMGPNIPSGSAVLVHEGHYRVGQVITFKEDGLTVTHRLISISASGLTTTKGDGNPTNDTWHVPTSQIIGGVVVAPRYLGYWITYFKDPLGLASVVLVFLALWQIWSLTGDPSSEVAERNEPKPQKARRPLLRILTFRRAVPSASTRVALAYAAIPELEEHVSTPATTMVLSTGVPVEERREHVSPMATTMVLSTEFPVKELREHVSPLGAQTVSRLSAAAIGINDGFTALALELHPPAKVPHAKLKEPMVRTVPRVREENPPIKSSPAKLLKQYESTARTNPTRGSSMKTSPATLLKQYESTAPKSRELRPPRKLPSASLKVRDRLG